MLRNRSFVLGLGLGLLMAALLMPLLHAAEPFNSRIDVLAEDEGEQTGSLLATADKQIREAAETRGYLLHTAAELEAYVQQRIASALEVSDETGAGQPAAAQTVKIALYLPGGLNSEEISQALYLSGAVSDPEQFLLEVRRRGLGKVIRAGYYEFAGMQDVAALLEQMTGNHK